MGIEIIFQSIVIQADEVHGELFGLGYEIGRYDSSPKKRRGRKRKPKITMGSLIDRIIEDVEDMQICSE